MNSILDSISSNFSDTDDPNLWRSVLSIACSDISKEVAKAQSTRDLFLVIGPCSSWLRPHQTRWRVGDMEFAWPSGYGGVGYSRSGLPALDWCCCFQYGEGDRFSMVDIPHKFKHRQIILRIAIPARTTERRKASINMFWTPGTPSNFRRSVVRILALSRENTRWKLVGSHLDPGILWRGELLPPPKNRINSNRSRF